MMIAKASRKFNCGRKN